MHLILQLDSDSTLPLYKRMANAICRAVNEGFLKYGQVMPSSRELAECMAVSRLTARRCYEELSVQGYIRSHSRGKTFVSKYVSQIDAQIPEVDNRKSIRPSQLGQRLLFEQGPDSEPIMGSTLFGLAPSKLLPLVRWQECLYEAVRGIGVDGFSFKEDAFGSIELRKQIQALVSRTRGIHCSSEQIIVFPSTEGGLDLLCRLSLREDDLVAIEDPCFVGIRKSFRLHGAKICSLPNDGEGIKIDSLADLEKNPRLIYITPHQDTSGVPMSGVRRHRLLQWVASNDSLIVEDDFDSEYRYGEEPQPALFSQDHSGSVVYRYNFWKSLYPLVKMSFMIVPTSMVPTFRRMLDAVCHDTPLIEQMALAAFISRGHYERYLSKSRKNYAVQRASLFYAFAKVGIRTVQTSKQTGGTTMLIRLSPSLSDDAIDRAAQQAGLSLQCTRANYADLPQPKNEYLISFSAVDPMKIEAQVATFVSLLEVEQTAPLAVVMPERVHQAVL